MYQQCLLPIPASPTTLTDESFVTADSHAVAMVATATAATICMKPFTINTLQTTVRHHKMVQHIGIQLNYDHFEKKSVMKGREHCKFDDLQGSLR